MNTVFSRLLIDAIIRTSSGNSAYNKGSYTYPLALLQGQFLVNHCHNLLVACNLVEPYDHQSCFDEVYERGQRLMIFAEEIRKSILKLAEERGTERTFALSEVARAMDEKNWLQLIDQVKFVAGVLIDEGKIIPSKSSENNHIEFSKAPLNGKKSSGT